MFGEDVFDRFMKMNKVSHFIRAHQICMEGFQKLFGDRFITVWSAPNYLYRFGNMASILEIDETKDLHFNVFADAPENKKLKNEKSMQLVNDKQYFI
jgi:serine/threonine-protein phosphatase PPG1